MFLRNIIEREGTCDECGRRIKYIHIVEDAENNIHHFGSECINRVMGIQTFPKKHIQMKEKVEYNLRLINGEKIKSIVYTEGREKCNINLSHVQILIGDKWTNYFGKFKRGTSRDFDVEEETIRRLRERGWKKEVDYGNGEYNAIITFNGSKN